MDDDLRDFIVDLAKAMGKAVVRDRVSEHPTENATDWQYYFEGKLRLLIERATHSGYMVQGFVCSKHGVTEPRVMCGECFDEKDRHLRLYSELVNALTKYNDDTYARLTEVIEMNYELLTGEKRAKMFKMELGEND